MLKMKVQIRFDTVRFKNLNVLEFFLIQGSSYAQAERPQVNEATVEVNIDFNFSILKIHN